MLNVVNSSNAYILVLCNLDLQVYLLDKVHYITFYSILWGVISPLVCNEPGSFYSSVECPPPPPLHSTLE